MEKKSIENIFKQGLENYEIQPDEDEWSAIDLALPRVNFFRFSFLNFNIYYCSLIVLGFLFSALTLIYTLSERNVSTQAAVSGEKKKNEFTTFDIHNDQKGSKQIKKVSKPSDSQKVSVAKIKPNEVLITEVVSKNKSTTELNSHIPLDVNKDTLISKEESQHTIKEVNITTKELSQPEQQKKKEVKEKRIVYITKQDTIIVIDTLSKRKPKRKN